MSRVDEIFEDAGSLEPDDRIRLIVRLWTSLPPDHWAAPTSGELAEISRRLGDYNADRIDETPWDVVRRMLFPVSQVPSSKLYAATRRFDLFTIMIVTTAYAMLLGSMSVLQFPPIVSSYVAIFITLVGIGQAMLFGGTRPRLASALTGIVALFIGTVFHPNLVGRFDIDGRDEQVAFAMLFSASTGGILGYAAGVLVGGVFLVSDALRGRFGRAGDEEAASSDVNLGAVIAPHPLDSTAVP